MRRLVIALVALALAGCGSAAPADLPAPAGATLNGREVADGGRTFAIDRARDRLELREGARVVAAARTGREPTAVALLDRGRRVAVLCGRERVLEVYDARTLRRLGRAGAGIGPIGLTTDRFQLLYVTDVQGDALLVFHLRPRFELIRRVHVIGGPYAIAYDRDRRGLWIALNRAGRLVQYAAGNRPVLRETLRSIPGARAVSVEGGVVTVRSATQDLRVRSR